MTAQNEAESSRCSLARANPAGTRGSPFTRQREHDHYESANDCCDALGHDAAWRGARRSHRAEDVVTESGIDGQRTIDVRSRKTDARSLLSPTLQRRAYPSSSASHRARSYAALVSRRWRAFA